MEWISRIIGCCKSWITCLLFINMVDNLLPRELSRGAYDFVQRESTLTGDNIIDFSRRFQAVRVPDRSHMALMNHVDQPQMALSMVVVIPHHMSIRMIDLALYEILRCINWWSPTL